MTTNNPPDQPVQDTTAVHRECTTDPPLTEGEDDNLLVQWKLADLKEHPRQREYFPAESREADLELAADMDANGLDYPIEILPTGEILCGHRRVKAAKHLGWKEISTIERHDLSDDSEGAEALLIGDNYNRRQLTTFQKLRCAARRIELAKKGKAALPKECDKYRKTRDKIGFLAGMGGREADRYLKVLMTPIEVQNAFDAGHLTLVAAGAIASLDEGTQQQIADKLRDEGLDQANAIYEQYAPSKAETKQGATTIWSRLARALNIAEDLRGNMHNVRYLNIESVRYLERRIKLCRELCEELAAIVPDPEDDDDMDDVPPEELEERLAPIVIDIEDDSDEETDTGDLDQLR